MSFYEEYKGFIFKYDSVGDYFKALLWRLLGSITGLIIIGVVIYWMSGVNLLTLLFD